MAATTLGGGPRPWRRPRFAAVLGGCSVAVLSGWGLWGLGHTSVPPDARAGPSLPPAARGVVSRALGGTEPRFFVRPVAGGFSLGQASGGLTARFTRRDVVVGAGDSEWSLGLRSVGRGERTVPATALTPVAHGNQVSYRRGGVNEWYANGPLGLEQGFTVMVRPPGDAVTPLTLALGKLPAGMQVSASTDGRSVALTRGGLAVLRYQGLSARDARGRALPARIVLWGHRLALRVDDRGARYPVHVDPFVAGCAS